MFCWSEVILDYIVTIFKSGDDLETCYLKIESNYPTLSRGAIRDKLRREGYPNPTSLLGGLEEELSDVTDESQSSGYTFSSRDRVYFVPEGVAKEFLVLYSKKGQNLSSHKAADLINKRLSEEGNPTIPVPVFRKLVRKMGVNKDSEPLTDIEVKKDFRTAVETLDEDKRFVAEKYLVDIKKKKIEAALLNFQRLNDQFSLVKADRRVDVTWKENKEKPIKIIPFSDLHAGKKVKELCLTKPQNVYNKDIVLERVERVTQLIRMDKTEADFVYVCFMGDLFEALLANMRPGQHMTTDVKGFEQYELVLAACCKVIDAALETNPDAEIMVLFQGGNHDRLLADKSYESEMILNQILCNRVQSEYPNYDGLTICAPSPVASIVMENGVNLITCHGHNSAMRSHNSISAFNDVWSLPSSHRSVIMNGHYHSFSVDTSKNWRRYQLSSICGDDAYNLEKLSISSNAEFMMLHVYSDHDEIKGCYPLT